MSNIGAYKLKHNLKSYLINKPNSNANKKKPKISYSNCNSLKAKSAKPNNMPQIYKQYQQFCAKYFNSNELNNEIAMNQRIKEEKQHQCTPLSPYDKLAEANFQFLLDNEKYDFAQSVNYHNELLIKLEFSSNTQSIGLEKNNKIDYNKRFQRLSGNELKDDKDKDKDKDDNGNSNNEEKYNDEEFNYGDDFEGDNKDNHSNDKDNNDANDNVNYDNNEHNNKEQENNASLQKQTKDNQIFDDSTYKIITEESKNQSATKIQLSFKNQLHYKRKRDRVFLGYDKTMQYILFIYIDKKALNDNGETDILSLLFKIYSIATKEVFIKRKDIKELLFDNSIVDIQLTDALPDIIEKILNENIKNEKEDQHKEEEEKDDDEFNSNYSLNLDSRDYSDT